MTDTLTPRGSAQMRYVRAREVRLADDVDQLRTVLNGTLVPLPVVAALGRRTDLRHVERLYVALFAGDLVDWPPGRRPKTRALLDIDQFIPNPERTTSCP